MALRFRRSRSNPFATSIGEVAVMTDPTNLDTDAVQTAGKREWSKPEISSFEAVTVTRGASFRIGDGVSNLS